MAILRKPDPNAFEAQLASAIYLAGSALTAVEGTEVPQCAVPEGDDSEPLLHEFEWLRDLVACIKEAVAQDPRRAELLRQLPRGLGNGDMLQILFANLFPEQRNQRRQAHDGQGRRELSETQIEVLQEYAKGKSGTEIAGQRGCTPTNIHNILKAIETRLHTQSPLESVALAISKGYLPLDIMGFVKETAHCDVRDYSPLDCQISANRLQDVENPEDRKDWQELGAFGLLLMLATNTVSGAVNHITHVNPATGVLYRLDTRREAGQQRARRIVGPGRLRAPVGLAVAPPDAGRNGFLPGGVYVADHLCAPYGMNVQQIVEFEPDGTRRRAFCGGHTLASSMSGTKDLAFDHSGALLVTGGSALLRFTEGGARTQPLVLQCCTGICSAPKGQLYLAHSSTRGGSVGVYTRNGRVRQQFGQQPLQTQLSSLQLLPNGEIAALCCIQAKPDERSMQIYDASGEFVRSWRVPHAGYGAFAFNAWDDHLYIPCPSAGDLAVYALDGTLARRIPLDNGIAPYAVAFDHDGVLWCVGSIKES